MFTRLLQCVIGALFGGVITFVALNRLVGVIDWRYVAAAAVATGLLGLFFGHSIVYTFKSVVKLR